MKIGDRTSSGKYTIIGIKEITHGKLFPNKNIKQQVSCIGKRGGLATFYVNQDGGFNTKLTGKLFSFTGHYHLNGADGSLTEIIAVV